MLATGRTPRLVVSNMNFRVNAEVLRVLLDHERGCWSSYSSPDWYNRATREHELVSDEQQAERKTRYDEAHNWVQRAMAMYLEDNEGGES